MERHIIEFNIYCSNGLYYIEPIVDGKNKKRLNEEFLTEEAANEYLLEHKIELEKRYMPRPRKPKNSEVITVNSENASVVGTNVEHIYNGSKKGEKIIAFGTGLLAGALVGPLVFTSCCKGKGTKQATDPDNGIVIYDSTGPRLSEFPVDSFVPTDTASLQPIVTLSPVTSEPTIPTEEPVTVDAIDLMANDILTGYMSINPSVSNIQVISNGELIGTKVTESDIKNAITLLNIDDLSMNNNTVFKELVGNQQPDAMYQNNQFLMCNLIALNMQEYYTNHSTDKFIWFSPMLINQDDKNDMQILEGYVKSMCDTSLESKDCNSLMSEFIKMLDNQKMLNRGNGFDSILVMYLELINNTCQNSISNDYRETIKDIELWKQQSSYVGTMNILNSNHNLGCSYNSGYSKKRIRNM